jgi:hypothetical protein
VKAELLAYILREVRGAHLAPTVDEVASCLQLDIIDAANALTILAQRGQLQRVRRNGDGPWCYRAAPARRAELSDEGGGLVELGIRFALWAQQNRRRPTADEVMAAFGVSRATAYRYCAAWQSALDWQHGVSQKACA